MFTNTMTISCFFLSPHTGVLYSYNATIPPPPHTTIPPPLSPTVDAIDTDHSHGSCCDSCQSDPQGGHQYHHHHYHHHYHHHHHHYHHHHHHPYHHLMSLQIIVRICTLQHRAMHTAALQWPTITVTAGVTAAAVKEVTTVGE